MLAAPQMAIRCGRIAFAALLALVAGCNGTEDSRVNYGDLKAGGG